MLYWTVTATEMDLLFIDYVYSGEINFFGEYVVVYGKLYHGFKFSRI